MMKNTVSATGQLSRENIVSEISQCGNKRILFLGNSITRHGPCEDIGWHGDWGMAASSAENDFVHILMNKIRKSYGDMQYMIASMSSFSSSFWDFPDFDDIYKDAMMYKPDVLIVRMGENISAVNAEKYPLYDCLLKMIDSFRCENTKVIITDCFWESKAVDEVLHRIAEDRHYPFVHLGDLGNNGENMAVGLFEHSGVAMHPGDLGMKRIAERIFEVFPEL